MLRNTFLHIPGIGKTTERRIWQDGCSDWDSLLSDLSRVSCGSASKKMVKDHLEKSQAALEEGNHQFFRPGLRMAEAWRAFPEFRHSCVYLDIETDNLMGSDCITTIGLYDGKEYTCLVQGQDLENFRDLISHYSMIVTFFGTGFDVPVLQRQFRGLDMDQIHIDLCPTLKRIGVRGGLKKIEKDLGIERSPETVGLNGYDAVLLWRRYRLRRDEKALERLIAYNREDCVNMERIAEFAYARLREDTLSVGAVKKVEQPALI